jgi:bifunctional DNA-binding transcriptional regulator/antitoxin component of YhaV-PrlF toxin-antitoxin module
VGLEDYLTAVNATVDTTITLSSKGQFSIPKDIRESDALEASDVFSLKRLARGEYVLRKLAPPERPKAKLVRTKDGFLVFRGPKGSPKITSDLVKRLEAETV